MNSDGNEFLEEPNAFDDELENDDDEGISGLGLGSLDRPVFEDANYKYSLYVGSSPYLTEITNHIKALPLMMRYKMAWLECVYTLFTPEQVLADNHLRVKSKLTPTDPLEKILLLAQLQIELTRCSATKYDMLVVNTYELEKNVYSVYRAFVTRTLGDRRERLINSEISTRGTTQVVNSRPKIVNNQQKRGWFRR